MSTHNVNIYTLLKEERKRLGFSQADLAAKCGVSREMWGKYERGDSLPGAEVFQYLIKEGADVNYILTGSRVPIGTQEPSSVYNRGDVDILINAYAHADDVGRAALMAVVALIKKSN